jgi:hypothetical protein
MRISVHVYGVTSDGSAFLSVLICSAFGQVDFMEQLKVAGQHAKPYQILGPLGKGKFAMVYKAQLGTELYALKKVAVRHEYKQQDCAGDMPDDRTTQC